MVALSELDGNARVHHIFTAAERSADAEHGVFIRAVVRTDSSCIGSFIIAVACGKVPFVIRIEIKRMESGKCSSPCADSVDTVAQFINSTIQVNNAVCIVLYLTVQDRQILSGRIIHLYIDAIIRDMRLIIHGLTGYDAGIPACNLPISLYIDFIGRASVFIWSFINSYIFTGRYNISRICATGRSSGDGLL